MNYEEKYLKYKEKYFKLKNQISGNPSRKMQPMVSKNNQKDHYDPVTGLTTEYTSLTPSTLDDIKLIFKYTNNLYYYNLFCETEEYNIYLNNVIPELKEITNDMLYNLNKMRYVGFFISCLHSIEFKRNIAKGHDKGIKNWTDKIFPEFITTYEEIFFNLTKIFKDLNDQINVIYNYISFVIKRNKIFIEYFDLFQCKTKDFESSIINSVYDNRDKDREDAISELYDKLSERSIELDEEQKQSDKVAEELLAELFKDEGNTPKKGKEKTKVKESVEPKLSLPKKSVKLQDKKPSVVKLVFPNYFNSLPIVIKQPTVEINDADFNEEHEWHIVHKINIFDIMQIYLNNDEISSVINDKLLTAITTKNASSAILLRANITRNDRNEIFLRISQGGIEFSHLSIHQGLTNTTPETLYHYKFKMTCVNGKEFNISYKLNFNNIEGGLFVFNRVWSRDDSAIYCIKIDSRHNVLMDIIIQCFNESLLNPNNLYQKILKLQILLKKTEDKISKGLEFDISPYESIELLKSDISKFKSWMK